MKYRWLSLVCFLWLFHCAPEPLPVMDSSSGTDIGTDLSSDIQDTRSTEQDAAADLAIVEEASAQEVSVQDTVMVSVSSRCFSASECPMGQVCDPMTRLCRVMGTTGNCADEDGDGHRPRACGGQDCDDHDRRRSPGNMEVCDSEDLDEDCNLNTHGTLDGGLEAGLMQCCNIGEDGIRRCGGACDPRSGATRMETCNGLDDDCNGLIDDGAAIAACRDTYPTARNTLWECGAGSCAVQSCERGYGDCDGRVENGCEVDLSTQREHCGACGNRCPGLQNCVAGSCSSVPAQGLSSSFDHNCVWRADGRVACWGEDGDGKLGISEGVFERLPHRVLDAIRVEQVSAGSSHTCVRTREQVVACWGDNDTGQLGNGSYSPTPIALQVPSLSSVAEVRARQAHTCARTNAGEVYCWGNNASGQLGNGGRNANSNVPVRAGTLTNTAGLALGFQHTCVRFATGAVSCWGDNSSGQFGNGTTTSRSSPTSVPGLSMVEELVAGRNHTCARRQNGTVSCWGGNAYGALGDGTLMQRNTPTVVAGLGEVIAIAAGDDHTCAVRRNGEVWCWGYNGTGALGNRSSMNSSVPVQVVGLNDAVSISAGGEHTCARRQNGQVVCWGYNALSQLGDQTTRTQRAPVPVGGLLSVVEISAGEAHTCARLSGGSVVCWGDNRFGQLGDGIVRSRLIPTELLLERELPDDSLQTETVQRVVAGGTHTCALTATGKVICWGGNEFGQLGDGTVRNRVRPVLVPGLDGVAELSLGMTHSCARTSMGVILCWGDNRRGQLGDGTTISRTSPVAVSGLMDAVDLGVGANHSCVVRRLGNVSCWGSCEAGQIGDGCLGATSNRLVPTVVSNVSGAVEVAGGGLHSCARRMDNTVSCWGSNQYGQLGSTSLSAAPRTVQLRTGGALGDLTQISLGTSHSCGQKSNGIMYCWGTNAMGQSGISLRTADVNYTADFVSNITDATAVTTGSIHSCSLRRGGQVECWGTNDVGQLGDGTLLPHYLPARVTTF